MIANQHIDISDSRSHTVISFDNGARWKRIASPANDLNGLPINCSLVRLLYVIMCVIYINWGGHSLGGTSIGKTGVLGTDE